MRLGKPRLAVQDVTEYLAGGDTPEELREAFPEVPPERLRAYFAFSAEHECQCVTLLLDHNLSYRVLAELEMDEAADLDVWRLARERGWAIMSKSSDWADLSLLYGAPPKVFRLRIGNGLVLGGRGGVKARRRSERISRQR